MRYLSILAALAVAPIGACGDSADTTPEEPTAGSAVQSGKADGADGTRWTYFIVSRQDYRRCISPVCGGVFVKRLNQSETKCADGKWAKDCYVGDFDFGPTGLKGEEAIVARNQIIGGQAIFRGQIKTGYFEGDFKDIPAFEATEVWTAGVEGKAPTGTFFVAEDAGIVCITTPCASIDAIRLNRNANPYDRYAGIDFGPSGAGEELISKAWSALQSPSEIGGLVVAGKVVNVTGPGGKAKGLKVNQFYFPVTATASDEGRACGSRGMAPCGDGYFCQWDNIECGKADRAGVCTKSPEFCADEYQPVCGCDGMTYSNDCFRAMAGSGFGEPGECESACEIGGCSGELCTEKGSGPNASICIWREEFACYQTHGICETQPDGTCGWTPTEELTSCLGPTAQQ